jgi:methionyl aminopeptidase
MAIIIKTDEEIELMRQSGHLLAKVHDELHAALRPGISTLELDQIGEETIRKLGGIPNCKDYEGFPASVCISVNDEVVHGIPSGERILVEGDIVTFDTGLIYKGYHSDAARTNLVGNVSEENKLLAERTKQSFFEALKVCIPGNHVNDIGRVIEDYIEPFGYGIVDEYTGHGIGRAVHEDPDVCNFATVERGPKLRKNMTLAIEPMINLGTEKVEVDNTNGWTVKTKDGKCSSHYENTIVITDNGPEILSLQ